MDGQVQFDTHVGRGGFSVAVATLNNARSLNALSLAMINALLDKLKLWQQDPTITVVVLRGAGERAFCAGGDVRAMYHASAQAEDKRAPKVETFFTQEYRLDYLIHRYPKPVIAWGSGVVMGGGLGLMAGASHRIVTESSVLAMPEIAIGLYPDVGATWFLNRMPGHCGRFLGLTGYRMNGADAQYVGLADYQLSSKRFEQLLQRLCQLDWTGEPHADGLRISIELLQLEQQDKSVMEPSRLQQSQQVIDDLMEGDSIEVVANKLKNWRKGPEWLDLACIEFVNGSPVTATLVWHQVNQCSEFSLEEAFQQELIWSVRCAEMGDFVEGVRALLVDKDGKPRWRFAEVSEIPDEWMARLSQSPWSCHPLTELEGKTL